MQLQKTSKLAAKVLISDKLQLTDSYDHDLRSTFGTSIESVNFRTQAARIKQRVNEFVAEKTSNMITRFLDEELDRDTMLYLLNAIYFESNWAEQFNASRTTSGKFENIDGSETTVMFMRKNRTNIG